MKKTILILGAIIVTMAIVWSCSKESNENIILPDKNESEALKAFNRIVSFKNKIANYNENPNYKSGEIISIEDLLWEFNAALNFDHSEVDQPYMNFFSEPVFVEIAIDQDNMVNIDDAAQVYLQLEADIQNVLTAAPFEEKAVKFTYVKIESTENQTLTLQTNIAIGEKGTDNDGPFGSDDDWMYGDDLGKCDGTYFGQKDSGEEIETMVESRRHLYIDDAGQTVFYVNPFSIVIDKDDIDSNPLLDLTNGQGYDNDMDYRIFYAHDNNCPTGTTLSDFECIDNYDMNDYYFAMENLIYNIIPNQPTYWPQASGDTFVRFEEINGTMKSDPQQSGKNYLIHIPEIVFARRQVLNIED